MHPQSARISKNFEEEPGEHANQDSPCAVVDSLNSVCDEKDAEDAEIYCIAGNGW